MSKKTKRQVRKVSAASTVVVTSSADKERTTSYEFKPDYSQTIKDLRRIGILAGTFFGVLIVLSFFLR